MGSTNGLAGRRTRKASMSNPSTSNPSTTNPRPEKAAAVAEARERFESSDAALLTEYRGLDVAQMSELRRCLRAVGGDYKIYKNTMVRLAVSDLDADLSHLLNGPTAIAFVGAGADGGRADPSAVAKALKDFSRANRSLVLKGGLLADRVLSVEDLLALADLPSRDVLLARIAGAFSAPMSKFAGLLQALPRDFAYGLQALIDSRAGEAPAQDAAQDVDPQALTDEPSGEDSGSSPDASPDSRSDDPHARSAQAMGAHEDQPGSSEPDEANQSDQSDQSDQQEA